MPRKSGRNPHFAPRSNPMKTGTTVILIGLGLLAGPPILPLMTSTGDFPHLVLSVLAIITVSDLPFLYAGTFMAVMDLAVGHPRALGLRTSLRAVHMMTFMMRVLLCLRRGLMTHTCPPGLLSDVPALPPGAITCLLMTVVHTGKFEQWLHPRQPASQPYALVG